MNKKITLILFSLIFAIGGLTAQSMKAYLESIDKSVAKKDYGTALYFYRIVIDDAETSDIQQIFNGAETARKYRSYEFAEAWYTKVVESEMKEEYPTAWFGLGEVRKSLGKYTAAMEAYSNYLEYSPQGIYAERATKEINDCETALALNIDLSKDSTIIHLDERVNTTYSEVSAFRHKDKLYYTSLRFDSKGEDPEYCCAFGRTLASKGDYEGQLLEGNFNDTIWHTINSRYDSEHQRIYYNQCKNLNASEVRCEIYFRAVDDSGNWGPPNRLGDYINLDGYTATQPSVGVNPDNGKTYLFFSSDRPEGKGGMDIWCSIMGADGTFSAPINIDAFNSELDDVTPFYHAASNRLFLSSNGRSSLGGYDVYYSTNKYGEWGEAMAMESPVNSSFDEAFFSLSSGLETPKGYFSSNRPGTFFKDTLFKYSCNDIFSFDIEIKLQVLTYNAVDSLTEWDSCTVRLVDLTEGVETTLTNLKGHDFDFGNLKSDHEYMVIGNREDYVTSLGFIADTLTFNTFGVFSSKKIVKKLYLRPKIELQVFTFNETDDNPLAGCKVELYDITEKRVVMERLIPLDSNMDGNEFWHRYLFYGHIYRITASKRGYTQDVNLITDKLKGSKSAFLRPRTITENLYLKLEFELTQIYFNNDVPGPSGKRYVNGNRVYNKTTPLAYDKTYNDYKGQLGYFKRQFRNNPEEQTKLDSFFYRQVFIGWDRLEALAGELVGFCQDPTVESINITFEGYASPLADSIYNVYLTERRVNCLENYFRNKSPAISKAIDENRLNLRLKPMGEIPGEGAGDNRRDVKSSIYSVAASKLRRVDIKDFDIIYVPDKLSTNQ